MVQPGTVLAGKYQVERVLGQGGMGCVVSALHQQLGQRVAIKFLLPHAMSSHEAVERFLREARAAVRLRSEHVGRVIDVGQFDDGAPYIVMEYLDGMDLATYLARVGPVSPVVAVDFVLQACEAIAEAHSLGIVHRDLKPANLFLTHKADGSPLIKVLDFGISKAQQSDPSFNLTRTTSVMGSPGYMSPEQLRSAKDCDARTDVWALGVILYELTTGKQPFVAESITELALKVAIDPAPPMSLPDAPPGFEAVVMRCLGKDPPDRYPHVAALAAALVPYGSTGAADGATRISRVLQVAPSGFELPGAGRAPTGPVVTAATAPTTLGSAATSGETHRTMAGAPSRRTGVIVGFVVAFGVAGGALAAITLGGGGATEERSGAPAVDDGAGTGSAGSGEVTPVEPPVTTPDAGAAVEVVPTPDAEVTTDAAAMTTKDPGQGSSKGKGDGKGKGKGKGKGDGQGKGSGTGSATDDDDFTDSRF